MFATARAPSQLRLHAWVHPCTWLYTGSHGLLDCLSDALFPVLTVVQCSHWHWHQCIIPDFRPFRGVGETNGSTFLVIYQIGVYYSCGADSFPPLLFMTCCVLLRYQSCKHCSRAKTFEKRKEKKGAEVGMAPAISHSFFSVYWHHSENLRDSQG